MASLHNKRTSHNLAIISSTGGGKSFTMKKMIVNEFARGTKIFIFDAENEYEKLVKANGGEYIDLYSKKGGIINPLQIRYIPSDDSELSISRLVSLAFSPIPAVNTIASQPFIST